MAKVQLNRIAIIGLGLIGSSIARAVRERNLAKTIIGCDANELSLAYAKKHGFIDLAVSDPQKAVKDATLIVLAAPPSQLGDIAAAIAPHLQKGAIIVDVCSVKEAAIAAIAPHIPDGADFIPSHPIAGSEQSGVAAGRGDLFERRQVIITPDEPLDRPALKAVTAFWQALGARVEGIPAPLHDQIYAYVSHLPQLLAFVAVKPLAEYQDDKNLEKFLRLSGSNPAMWAEIFTLNSEYILAALDRYLDAIAHIINELAETPAEEAAKEDIRLSRTVLFPRIAASCLITTVMEAEKKMGFSFGRYAGAGFADFTNPAALPPDNDIERISGQGAGMVAVLADYVEHLKAIRAALAANNAVDVEKML